jgi:hypothetical protein
MIEVLLIHQVAWAIVYWIDIPILVSLVERAYAANAI